MFERRPPSRRRTTLARHALVLGAAASLALPACSGSAGGPAGSAGGAPRSAAAPTAATGSTADAAAEPAGLAAPTPQPAPAAVLSQAWATAELTDVCDGSTFRIADLVASGRVVFIETMAIWCTNCRAQQRDVVTALAGLDPERVTWIGVDVDRSESAGGLADYSRTLGFDWPFVVGSTDLLRAIATDFGDQVLSPPSTPIIVVGTDGTVTLTEFGPKSVDRIVELATANGA